jgi:CrcB protein
MRSPIDRPRADDSYRRESAEGVCLGARLTTFSSFSLQTLNLAQDGEFLQAGLNIVGSMVLCLLAVWLG